MTSLTNAPDIPATVSLPQQSTDEAVAIQVQHLMVAVEHILRAEPGALTELELIKKLQAPPWKLIGPIAFNDPAKLFPVHFLLFHTLYQLRDRLFEQGDQLSISPLAIQLDPSSVVAGQGLPGESDALRAFYLDLKQYELSDASIRQMMDDFWAGQGGKRPSRQDLASAADILGLDCIPAEFGPVKQRFRRAVMQAHPDRGGDTRRIQELNEAFALFRTHFQQTKKRPCQ